MRNLFYKLENHQPVPCSPDQSYGFSDMEKRRVGWNEIDGIKISTVFLVIDHNYSGQGDPVLFETMIFNGPFDGYQERYCTWEKAEEGHNKAVAKVKKWIDGEL